MLLLGHVISQNGIEADPEKVKALFLMDPPSSVQGLASFVHKLCYICLASFGCWLNMFIPCIS